MNRLVRTITRASGVVALGWLLVSSTLVADPPPSLPPIDLTQFHLTFEDNFDTLDVSAWGPGTKWIAHTPWAGDFGAAKFGDPGPNTPFQINNGILQITLQQTNGKWQGGLLSSADPKGGGYLQQYGYFEMRAKFPPGYGTWPGFWLVGRSTNDRPEIDIIEYYGRVPDHMFSTYHIWAGTQHWPGASHGVIVPTGSLEQDFHTYGVDIEPTTVTYYLDRQPVWQHPTLDPQKQPLMILVNLALEMTWQTQPPPSPSYMYVDYIRAYQLNVPANP